ncbi:sigma-70 family RNA polymerase sigma factor family protein [Streptosporangium soli]|nr:hypothetical protein [Streptosporangium sp. KLBMP 9127]
MSLAFPVLLENLSPHQRAAFLLRADDGRIQTIHSTVNPDKLRHLDQVSDLGARLRAQRRSGGNP